MLADSVNNFSISSATTTTDISNGYYTPVIEFAKYDYVNLGRNCEFIITVLELGNTVMKKNKLYVSSYNINSSSKINFIELEESELECFIEEKSDNYTLYVKPTSYGTVIITQINYCRNINYANPVMGVFDKDILTAAVPIYPSKAIDVYMSNNKITKNLYKTVSITSTAKYIKIGNIYTNSDTQGNSISFDIEERQNGNNCFIAGRIYIKVRKGSSNISAYIRSVGTEDLKIENINVICVKTTDYNVDIYLKVEKAYTRFFIKPNIYEIHSGTYNNITLFSEQTPIEKLPLGTLYPLFEPTEDNPLEQEETI